MNQTGQLCVSLLQTCKTLNQLGQVQALVCKTGLESDPFVAGKLMLSCALSVFNSVDHARRLFHDISNPDVFICNTLARALSESSNNPKDALQVFVEMRSRALAPDSFSFAFLLKAAANMRALQAGTQLHCQALVCGFNTHQYVGTTLVSVYGECGDVGCARKVFDEITQPNVVAWNALLTACLRSEDITRGERVFKQMPSQDLTSWNVMLAGYAKAGEIELARGLFSKMPVKDDVSWSTMIAGFVQTGYYNEAIELFRELKRVSWCKAKEVSLTSVLSACAQAGALEFGKVVHGLFEKSGFHWIVAVNNALLDMYSKCGSMGMASLVFNTMADERSVVSWTVMISGLAMHGHGAEALDLFVKMEESGVKPDEITFISLLYACSHTGFVEKGLEYFDKMINVYGMEPSIEHYGCIVDLYGRSGMLNKAHEFILRMPIAPTAIIWRTLLGACSIHGDFKLAEQVKAALYEFEPLDPGDHVLLSNTYAVSGKWRDVVLLRRSMIGQGIRKPPGWSMIEIDKTMYKFVAGGDKHSEFSKQAHEKLKEIMERLRIDEGYVPETTSVMRDIEDEEKEDAVWMHSEKLAVAFGMLNLCKGKSLRIFKNLRICRDCHSVMRLISRVYGLEIVVRDRSRFHTFKEGSCTCGDYW